MSAFGQAAVPDTVYVYETVTVFDTIVVRDTVRVKKAANMPALPSVSIDHHVFEPPAENNLPPTATFSENCIILHENNHQKNVKIMKLNTASKLSAIILTAQTMAGIPAQETQPADDLTTFPMQFSIVYPMTTQGSQTVNYRYNVSFNLFSGRVGAVKGVEIGTFFNQTERDVQGVQTGGLANRTNELTGVQVGGLGNAATTVNGIQLGGLANICKDVTGVQFGGITNIADSTKGLQLGGIANISKETDGLQFGGITNLNERTKGMQFAGIVNVTEQSDGFQFAGITNISREVSGASFAGILNRTGTLRGFQFGIVNVIDTVESGVSMAIINIVKKGFYSEWALNVADYQNIGVSYKMGMQKCYTIFTAGANFMEDKLWAFGIGFGNRTALNNRFDFQPEIVSYQYFPTDFRNVQYTSATYLKFGFVYKLNDKIGITLAPSIYHINGDLKDSGQPYKISPVKEIHSWKSKNNIYNQTGVGISVGIVISG